MILLFIVAFLFVSLEFVNVLALYFNPDTKKFNGIGVFSAWEKSKMDPEIHNLVRYLVYWIAGSKLIFIFLLFVIFIFGNQITQSMAILALIFSISTFFWKLYPLIKKMDSDSEIDPQGYSKTLGYMIFIFLVVFVSAWLVTTFNL